MGSASAGNMKEGGKRTVLSGYLLEIILLAGIISIALFVGFYDYQRLTHPLHGDLLLTGNAVYNIYNRIPYEVNGALQWLDEREHYFYIAPLYYYFSVLFWDNSRSYTENFIPSTIVCVIFTYIVSYLFFRRYFGRKVALTAIFFMSMSTFWLNYQVRSLYGPWASLPGFSILVFWLYIRFNETGKLRYMVYAGLTAGLGFYFTTWPLPILVIPTLFIMVFILPSETRVRDRFFGYFVFFLLFCAVIGAKELIFLKTGLKYPRDHYGIAVFIKIFFKGRYGASGNFAGGAIDIIPVIKKILYTTYVNFFRPNEYYPGGNLVMDKLSEHALPLMTALARFTMVPGLLLLLIRGSFVQRFLALEFIVFIISLTLLVNPVERYMLPVFSLAFLFSAAFIVWVYGFVKGGAVRYVLYLVLAAGVVWNGYETFHVYMRGVLPIYSKFEYNCYNSIEWYFEDLKKFLREKKTVYDIMVIPNNFTGQMVTYFRLHQGFVHLEGESYGKVVLTYNDFRKQAASIKARTKYSKMLIIANNFNHILNDNICPGWTNRLPYDKNAITMDEVKTLLPDAKFLRYAGNAYYPELVAVYEVEPEISVSVNGLEGSNPAICAFDGLNSFWEQSGELPYELTLDYRKEPVRFIKYAFRTGAHGQDSITRMPRDWKLQGSDDGVNWADIDVRKDQTGWKENEERVYSISKPAFYRKYRFVFTSSNSTHKIMRLYDIRLLEG